MAWETSGKPSAASVGRKKSKADDVLRTFTSLMFKKDVTDKMTGKKITRLRAFFEMEWKSALEKREYRARKLLADFMSAYIIGRPGSREETLALSIFNTVNTVADSRRAREEEIARGLDDYLTKLREN